MRIFVLLSLLISLCVGMGPLRADSAVEALAHGNRALRAWIERLSSDQQYLLLDRSSATIKLMHGRAELRACKLLSESGLIPPVVRDTLVAHMRRYRPLVPLVPPKSGPFDWEDRLVHEAPDDGALYFSSGTILAADSLWMRENRHALLVELRDFRALFNAGAEGLQMIYLPADWQRDE